MNTLSAELTLAADATVASLAVRQEAPPPLAAGADPAAADADSASDGLRIHGIAIGVYDQDDRALRRRALLHAEISGARTEVPGLAGQRVPDALILNDDGLAFAQVRLDPRTVRALAACALDVGDPLAEAVCWNATWSMTLAGELSAGDFIDLVIRRIARIGGPSVGGREASGQTPSGPEAHGPGAGAVRVPPGLADLLDRARTAADYYAGPASRPELRERLAAAALDALTALDADTAPDGAAAAAGSAARVEPARPDERAPGPVLAESGRRALRALTLGFAASVESAAQLDVLRSWLSDASRPASLTADPEVRGQILATLAARGRATGDDLDALAADPVGGEAQRATCRARQPDAAAKEAAWAAAITSGQPPYRAQAHARGIWVPGQEELLAPYRDRFFREALPALIAAAATDARSAQKLARLLYPATLADSLTLAATGAALGRDDLPSALRLVLTEQRAMLGEVLAARVRPPAVARAGPGADLTPR